MDDVSIAGPERECPAEWETCLDFEANGTLNRYLSAIQRWSLQAWIACKE